MKVQYSSPICAVFVALILGFLLHVGHAAAQIGDNEEIVLEPGQCIQIADYSEVLADIHDRIGILAGADTADIYLLGELEGRVGKLEVAHSAAVSRLDESPIPEELTFANLIDPNSDSTVALLDGGLALTVRGSVKPYIPLTLLVLVLFLVLGWRFMRRHLTKRGINEMRKRSGLNVA